MAWIGSLVLQENTGADIMSDNPVLKDYLIDVREWLASDVGSKWTRRGTCVETQTEIRVMNCFQNFLRRQLAM